jgi:hypothetical protein
VSAHPACSTKIWLSLCCVLGCGGRVCRGCGRTADAALRVPAMANANPGSEITRPRCARTQTDFASFSGLTSSMPAASQAVRPQPRHTRLLTWRTQFGHHLRITCDAPARTNGARAARAGRGGQDAASGRCRESRQRDGKRSENCLSPRAARASFFASRLAACSRGNPRQGAASSGVLPTPACPRSPSASDYPSTCVSLVRVKMVHIKKAAGAGMNRLTAAQGGA